MQTATADQARRLADDPAAFFGHSWHAMQHVPPEDLAELQIEGIRMRFAEMRERIPTLAAMAGEQQIEEIGQPEDIIPLLFQHWSTSPIRSRC